MKSKLAIPVVLLAVLSISLASVGSSMSFVYASTENDSSSGDEGDTGEEADEPEPEPEPETPTEPEPEPQPQPEDADTCQGGPPGIDGCPPPAEEAEPQPKTQTEIEPCLLDPSLPSCPKPGPNQDCPEGWAQNEDGNCFPLHPQGCPNGYHGHEDDETGRCIPNSTPCDPSYILVTGENNRKNCERKEFYCQTHEDDNRCNGNGNDHDKKIIIVKKIIKNIDIIKKIDNANSDGDLDVAQTIVAINYDEGAGINCVFDDDDNGQCETFDVNKDSGKEPLLQIIDFD